MKLPTNRARGAPFLLALAAACSEAAPEWGEIAEPGAVPEARRMAAERARDALASKLLAELGAALAEGGPANGIRVCSERAPEIAREVGAEHGVAIGRTSFRLRNAGNAPPAWAQAAVDAKRPEAAFFARRDGGLGALFPIRLGPQCVVCHGRPEQLDPAVVKALAELYPGDQATGFAPGDLRGWFWVEVP